MQLGAGVLNHCMHYNDVVLISWILTSLLARQCTPYVIIRCKRNCRYIPFFAENNLLDRSNSIYCKTIIYFSFLTIHISFDDTHRSNNCLGFYSLYVILLQSVFIQLTDQLDFPFHSFTIIRIISIEYLVVAIKSFAI